MQTYSFTLATVLFFAVFILAMLLLFCRTKAERIKVLALLVLPVSLLIASANFGGFHYKSGTMRCTVQQLDRQGVWAKTWEGVLVGSSRLPWHVSVVNDAPANMLREAMQNNRDVLVHYDEYRMRGWLLGSSEVVVTAVEP